VFFGILPEFAVNRTDYRYRTAKGGIRLFNIPVPVSMYPARPFQEFGERQSFVFTPFFIPAPGAARILYHMIEDYLPEGAVFGADYGYRVVKTFIPKQGIIVFPLSVDFFGLRYAILPDSGWDKICLAAHRAVAALEKRVGDNGKGAVLLQVISTGSLELRYTTRSYV
jgi:hypothetical protein